MTHRLTAATIDDEAALRALLGEPSPLVCAKLADRLVAETRPFVERAPFVLLATSDRAGRCDVSPRGDPPGFVRILDDRTLLLPERPGNRLADSLRNIVANPHVGLLFVVPGLIASHAMQIAVGDCQVSNLAAEIQARTIGLPLLSPSAKPAFGLEPTTLRIESAAPPRVSPSSLVNTTPVRFRLS